MNITHLCKCTVFDSLESTPVTAMKLYFQNVSLSLVCNFTHANHHFRKKNAESSTIDVSGIILCYETFRKLLCWTSSPRHHQLLNLSLLLEKVPKINKCTCIFVIRVKMCILNFNEIHIENISLESNKNKLHLIGFGVYQQIHSLMRQTKVKQCFFFT